MTPILSTLQPDFAQKFARIVDGRRPLVPLVETADALRSVSIAELGRDGRKSIPLKLAKA